MIEEFVYMGIENKWVPSIIQGYVGCRHILVNGKVLSLLLISRRKISQSGPNEYGINDEGDVAGDTETEIVLQHIGYTFSHVIY